ncbi:MAG: hypothetical protein ACK5R2_01780 [Cyanobacteriota bacterium]|jgi:hypothetical protein
MRKLLLQAATRFTVAQATGGSLVDNYIARVEAKDGQALEAGVKTELTTLFAGFETDGVTSLIQNGMYHLWGVARTIEGSREPLVAGPTLPTIVGSFASNRDRKLGINGFSTTRYVNSNRAVNADAQNSHHNIAIVRHTANFSGVPGGARTSGGSDAGGRYLFHDATTFRTTSCNLQDALDSYPYTATLNAYHALGFTRQSSTSYTILAGTNTFSHTRSSTTPITAAMYIGALNRGGASVELPFNGYVTATGYGAGCTATQLVSIRGRLVTFLNAIGGLTL